MNLMSPSLLSGFPSLLTSEYTANSIRQVVDEQQQIRLIGIVDYDPSGDIIAKAFQNQLAATGLPNSTLTTIIDLKYYQDCH